MEVKRKASHKVSVKYENSSSTGRPVTVTMYSTPPSQKISLDSFETFAFDRFQILQKSDELSMKELAKLSNPLIDVYSHFTLRLAFCSSEETRRWFCKNETKLFKFRFNTLTSSEKMKFCKSINYPIEIASKSEINGFYTNFPQFLSNDSVYFRIGLVAALDLIERRSVFLSNGFAYVSMPQLSVIIAAHFRSVLSQELSATFRMDNRIQPLLNSLRTMLSDASYKVTFSSESISPGDVERLSKQSFPLCMRVMYEKLKENHHLKYGARQQFGLFLKGIGLSLEGALEFWQRMFARKFTIDQFNKQYAYNVRYNYGKEGKRQDYTPYSCVSIIKSQPGTGEYHGCPFRLYDDSSLAKKLAQFGVNDAKIGEIKQLVRGEHYQLACREYFAATHETTASGEVGNHPNSYFEESVRLLKEKAEQT